MAETPRVIAPTKIVTEFRTTFREVTVADSAPFTARCVTASGFERRNILTSQIASL